MGNYRKIRWTKERCKEEAMKYPTRRQFQQGCQSAYQKAYKEHWLDEICSHMKSPYKPLGYWTKEHCAEEALKHQTRYAFQQANPTAYNKAIHNGWLEDICSHMVRKREGEVKHANQYQEHSKIEDTTVKADKEYILSDNLIYDLCVEEANKYKSRFAFQQANPTLYNLAYQQGIIDSEFSNIEISKSGTKWTKEKCAEEALKYNTRKDFAKGCCSAYNAAVIHKWLDAICSHMQVVKIPSDAWTKEKCSAEAAKYSSRYEFRRKCQGAYFKATREGWIDEICSHMKRRGREKKTKKKVGYIFKYTFSNGKIYIGQTRQSVERRLQEHIAHSKHIGNCTLCELAIAKYGRPKVETIKEIGTYEDDAKGLTTQLKNETHALIKKYESADARYGYNVKFGREENTAETFILQEAWYELYEKEKWAEAFSYIKYILENIRYKTYHSKEKLTKEEQKIWYGFKYDDPLTGNETTFSRHFNLKTAIFEEEWIYDFNIFDHALEDAIECVRQQIWKKINKKKEKIIKEWFNFG